MTVARCRRSHEDGRKVHAPGEVAIVRRNDDLGARAGSMYEKLTDGATTADATVIATDMAKEIKEVEALDIEPSTARSH